MSFNCLIYGDQGHGKSSLALTAPKPLLLIDTEAASDDAHYYKDGKVIYPDLNVWQPEQGAPDVAKHPVSVFKLRNYSDLEAVLNKLSEENPFKTVILDSITELESIVSDKFILPTKVKDWQDYGLIASVLKNKLRGLRAIMDYDGLNLIITATAKPVKGDDDKVIGFQPWLQNSVLNVLKTTARFIGYVSRTEHEDGSRVLKMLIDLREGYATKANSPHYIEQFGSVIENPDLSIIANAKKGNK